MIQSSKVQMPGVFPGGGGGMLKFRVDRRITSVKETMPLRKTYKYLDI